MASQITHIILAEQASFQLYTTHNRKDFIIGAIFPDIRYLKVIEREKTHLKGLAIADILSEPNSFEAGLKYHSLTDEVREAFIVEQKTYDLLPPFKYITQALKLYEDEILYSRVLDWNTIAQYMETILPEETQHVNQAHALHAWHSLVKEYIRSTPSDASREAFILGLGFPQETAAEINQAIATMRATPRIREIILELYEKWNTLIHI